MSKISALPAVTLGVNDKVPVTSSGTTGAATASQFLSSSLFTQSGTGAVARSINSKFGDIVSIKDFGAKGDGVTDDTVAASAWITACKSSGARAYTPAGTYKITSTLPSIAGAFELFGDGRQRTTFLFAPTADDVLFDVSNGAAQVLNVSMHDFGIKSTDTTWVKVALDVYDLTTCSFENIYIYGTGETIGPGAGVTWHDITNSSVGIRTHGRDSTNLKGLEIIADYPIYVAANPNSTATQCEDMDHWHWEDLYLLSARRYMFTVADGLGLQNLTFSGYQAWVGGTGGFFLNDTRVNPTVYTHNLSFNNIRGEQGLDANGYWFNITFGASATPGSMTFNNCFGDSTTQGITITKAQRVEMNSVTMATANGKNAIVCTPYAIDSVITWVNCLWQINSVVTMTDFLPATIESWDTTLNQAPSTATWTYKTANFGRQWFTLSSSSVAQSGTATASEEARATITIPKKILGLNGRIRVWTSWSMTNNGNNKEHRVRFSTITGTAFTDVTENTQATMNMLTQINNNNSVSAQKGSAGPGNNFFNLGSTSSLPTSAVDTDAADTTVVITGQKSTAGDTLTLESYIVEVQAGG